MFRYERSWVLSFNSLFCSGLFFLTCETLLVSATLCAEHGRISQAKIGLPFTYGFIFSMLGASAIPEAIHRG